MQINGWFLRPHESNVIQKYDKYDAHKSMQTNEKNIEHSEI